MRQDIKRVIAAVAAATALFGMSACGSNDASAKSSASASTQSQTQTQKEEPKAEPLDLTGTWKSKADSDTGNYWEATVKDDTITINMMVDKGDSSSLYWKGSYTAPTKDVETYDWTSKGDTDAMSKSLTASQDKTKDFSYKNSQITYKASAMGTTITVKLSKE